MNIVLKFPDSSRWLKSEIYGFYLNLRYEMLWKHNGFIDMK